MNVSGLSAVAIVMVEFVQLLGVLRVLGVLRSLVLPNRNSLILSNQYYVILKCCEYSTPESGVPRDWK